MNRPWVTTEIKELRRLYDRFDIKTCAEFMGRAVNSISNRVKVLGLKPAYERDQKKLYAEDIANLMELKSMGFSWREIGGCYPVYSIQHLRQAVYVARKHGFDAYPKRREKRT